MEPCTPQKFARVDRNSWMLWFLAFAVLLALGITVPVLYVPLLDFTAEADPSGLWLRNGYYTGIGLSGLVLVFCLYTAFKQRELNHMRNVLDAEERELENVRTRLSELSELFQLSTTLNLQLQLNAILEIIVRRVIFTLKAQQSSIMLFNPTTGLLETRASYGLESEFARHACTVLGEGIAGWVAQEQKPLLLGPEAPESQFGRHYKTNRHISSALSLPLRVGDRCVGVLNVNRINHPEPFREHHRDMLKLFAEHVGAVIDRAETLERLTSQAERLACSNQRLTELNRMKDVFLCTATHELKTPLTSVIAYAELLDDRADELSREQRGEFLARLSQEAQRLLALIDDILDLSRLETGKLVLRRNQVPVHEVVRAALGTVRSTAEKFGIRVAENLDAGLGELEVDEVKMRQVLVNLLVNAIKFSPTRGTVTIATRSENRYAVVEVHDQGPGIHPEEAAHIFELFGQGLRGAAEQCAGLGIGLHLVKRIVELHGGHVGVNSAPGEGSTFWVRLPLSLAAAGASRAA